MTRDMQHKKLTLFAWAGWAPWQPDLRARRPEIKPPNTTRGRTLSANFTYLLCTIPHGIQETMALLR
eukprot:1363740-Lingulodinium_polyedra.AAC.1